MSDHKETKILEEEEGEDVILEIESDESEQGLDSAQPPDNKKMKIMDEEEEEEKEDHVSFEIEDDEVKDDEPQDSLHSGQLQKKFLVLQNGVNKVPHRTGNLFGGYDIRGSPVLINGKPIDVGQILKLDNNGRRGSFVLQTNDPYTLQTSDKIYVVFVEDQTNIRVETDSYYLCNVHSNYIHVGANGNVVLRARNDTNTAFVRIRQCNLVVDQDISTNNIICIGGIGSQSDHIVSLPTGPKGNVDDVLAIDGVAGNIVHTKWSSPGEYGPVEYLAQGFFYSSGEQTGNHQEAHLFYRKSKVDNSRNIYHLFLCGGYSFMPLTYHDIVVHFNFPTESEHVGRRAGTYSVRDYPYLKQLPGYEDYNYNHNNINERLECTIIMKNLHPDYISIQIKGEELPVVESTGFLYSVFTF